MRETQQELEVRSADAVISFAGYLKHVGFGNCDAFADEFCKANELIDHKQHFTWPVQKIIILRLYVDSGEFGIFNGTEGYKVKRFRETATELVRKHSVVISWGDTSLVMGDRSGWLVIHTGAVHKNPCNAISAAYEDMKDRKPELCCESVS